LLIKHILSINKLDYQFGPALSLFTCPPGTFVFADIPVGRLNGTNAGGLVYLFVKDAKKSLGLVTLGNG